jgi:hypothetical protein
MSSRAFDKSNRTVRQGRILPATYGSRTAAQASDGPVDVWVDDMEGDWEDWDAILVGGGGSGQFEAVERAALVQRLAPMPLVPIPHDELVPADNLTDVTPVETRVMERTAVDK